ncbi:MAG TPA: hypothetical protein VK501_27960 [Baekduia sp.]|uniref:hypothetical protein n=1 Tax=Baekduia sp. TaxID=2600305 RepID=UPI002B784EFE|nr:hypothetical protein [Baekduia sp.]HMJ37775.1 hypothetical protein [Baekduia sp.]
MRRILGVCAATIAILPAVVVGPAQAAPPANDTFPGPGIAGSTFSGTTDQATRQVSEPLNAAGDVASAWYTWTAPSTGMFTIDLCSAQTPTDTMLGVYVGGSVGALAKVASSDDDAQCEGAATPYASAVTFPANAGTPYRVSVSGAIGSGQTGPFAGRIDPGPNTAAAGNPASALDSATGDSTMIGIVEGAASGSLACAVDGGAPVSCDNGLHMTGLADGPHVARVRATVAGQADPTPAVWRFSVDRTAPDTQLISADLSTPASPTFGFGATEAGSTFSCSLSATTFADCYSPTAITGLCAGTDEFRVRARDAAGNVDATPAAQTFSVPSGVCTTPTVFTDVPSSISDYGAGVFAVVNAGGGAMAVSFQYGPTASYGFETAPILAAGTGNQPEGASVYGTPGTAVHYRAIARTGSGLVFAGQDRVASLTVPAPGAPTITVGTPVVTQTTIDLPYTATVAPPAGSRKTSSGAVLIARIPPSSFQGYADLDVIAADGQPHTGTFHVAHLAPGTTVELIPAASDVANSRSGLVAPMLVTTAAADASGGGGGGVSPAPIEAPPVVVPGPLPPAKPPVKVSPLGKVTVAAPRRATLRKGRWTASVACRQACRLTATLTSGTVVLARASGKRTTKGTLKLKFKATSTGAKRLARSGKTKLALTVTATDALGLKLGTAKRALTFR